MRVALLILLAMLIAEVWMRPGDTIVQNVVVDRGGETVLHKSDRLPVKRPQNKVLPCYRKG